MTADIYKEATRCGEKKFMRKMDNECRDFGKLVSLKVNRQKEIGLVLAENAAAFPWLSSIAISVLFNDNPMAMYATIRTRIAQAINENVIKGGTKEQVAAAIDAKKKDSKEQGTKE